MSGIVEPEPAAPGDADQPEVNLDEVEVPEDPYADIDIKMETSYLKLRDGTSLHCRNWKPVSRRETKVIKF